MTELLDEIYSQTRQIIEEKGELCPELNVGSIFLTDLPMDSLDLATLIVNLELHTGLDPFKDGFKHFQSIGELTSLYESMEK
ncbi:hypothetical protein Sden_3108 [Shewanella denitrificans OS217]|uniref:Carrier domain-containing protein n=1 Tax=Shewanella denitrificans (strain OS217 / ATCC BAA-1090 / DSM 15013) TaxID=318161 RepID=Q12JJ1_SHEDO|nr:hypothetical protein [Shewanella denitrificans]ABE56385.1 hypothetical protein Sden_3108 [Shewanella denitrificans OS217]